MQLVCTVIMTRMVLQVLLQLWDISYQPTEQYNWLPDWEYENL